MLPQSFFDRSTPDICPELLGQYLCMGTKQNHHKFLITEIEAYDGMEDEACHARIGKTTRTAPMFGPPGHWYVYMIYGMYYMLNIVTGPGDHPSAILIRGVKQISPQPFLDQKRKLDGPGKLTKNLGIDKSFNTKIAHTDTGLWIAKNPNIQSLDFKIEQSPRIGIDYASKEWREKEWNFKLVEM